MWKEIYTAYRHVYLSFIHSIQSLCVCSFIIENQRQSKLVKFRLNVIRYCTKITLIRIYKMCDIISIWNVERAGKMSMTKWHKHFTRRDYWNSFNFFFLKMIDFHHFFGSKNWHKNKAIKVKYGMKRSEIKSCIEYHSHFIVLQF